MELPKFSLSFFFLLSILAAGHAVVVAARYHKHPNKTESFQAKKLFVFGDSYADTGNSDSNASSWKQPYGITFPGHPSGRYSDGRLLTDYVAMYYGLETPIASRFITGADDEQVRYGVNFAYGGTGVFDTGVGNPNITAQIYILKKLLNDSVIKKSDLESSLCLLSVAGNDYAAYLLNGGKIEDLPGFIQSVVNQLVEDMKTLHELGARKILVPYMPPQGCSPRFAESSTQCNLTVNALVALHDYFLDKAVKDLNRKSGDSSYYVLDFFNIFLKAYSSGQFKTPFKSCCVGTNTDSQCGSVDAQGNPLYEVCDDPKSAFYWDLVHLTEAGWHAVYDQALKQALKKIK